MSNFWFRYETIQIKKAIQSIKLCVVTLTMIVTPYLVTSQSTQFGFGLGKCVYWGDLNHPSFNRNVQSNGGFAFQFFGRKHINDYLSARANLLLAKVEGSDIDAPDEWQRQRNLRFKSSLNEVSLMAEVYPFKFIPSDPESVFSPYGVIGLGAFYFNPTTDYNGNTIALQPLGTEGQGSPGFRSKYNKFAAGLLFGGGAAFRINNKLILNLDVIGRRSTTDYLDDISGSYVNYNQLVSGNGLLAAELGDRTNEYLGISEPFQRETGTQRGGKLVKDYYFSGMVSLAITLFDSSSSNGNRNGNRGGFKGGRKNRVQCPTF